MRRHLLVHYEDEPQKVNFPGLLEVALYKHPEVTGSAIEEVGDDLQAFAIRFTRDSEEHEVMYIIDETIEQVEARGGRSVVEATLHLVDREIGADRDAGLRIVRDLLSLGVAPSRIWMVTAYNSLTSRELLAAKIRVYPKPSPHVEMIEMLIDLVFGDPPSSFTP